METTNLKTSNWQEDYRQALKSSADLERFFGTSFEKINYPIFLPLPLAERIKVSGIRSPLGLQFLPHSDENSDEGMPDPIGDQVHQKTKQLIHRYHNRALFIPTLNCPVICRYCFRKNELYVDDAIFKQDLEETKKYLLDHPEIEEIIFTGGDPFMISNAKLESYLSFFNSIESVKYIRFHTRTPVIMPSRIEDELVTILKKYSNQFSRLLIMIHVNHSDELGDKEVNAIKKMSENHLELFSQTVLLKGVNDNTEILYDLFKNLINLKVTPYYLHHPDQVRGGLHFTLSLEEGRKIYQPLRDLLSGWAIPEYIIDIPGGAGKTQAFNPENFQFSGTLIDKSGDYVHLFN